MKRSTVVIILLFILIGGAQSQKSYQQEFLVFHNMLMKPDTMLFSFWQQGDTVNVKRIIHQYVPMQNNSKTMDFSFRQGETEDAVQGSRLFNGKNIQYRFGTEKYLVRNDTLYKFVLTNRLSRDSLNTLFGHGENPKYFNKLEYQNNLKIIEKNRVQIKKVLYFQGMFEDGKKRFISPGEECADTISLNKRWQAKGKTYFAISVNFDCLKYPKKEKLILDNTFRFHAFDRKYLSRQMKPFSVVKPFKGRFFLKN